MKRSLYTFIAASALTAFPLAGVAADAAKDEAPQAQQQSETVQQYSTDAISEGKVTARLQGENMDYDQAKKKEPDWQRTAEGPRKGAWSNVDEDANQARGPEPDQANEAQTQVAGKTAEEDIDAAGAGTAGGAQTDVGLSSDQDITQRIREKLTEDDKLEAALIDVQAQDGVVTLQGQVGSEGDRERILELVRNTEGVTEVEANIDVQG